MRICNNYNYLWGGTTVKDYLYFISHSARDKDLARLFYNYLANAIGIPAGKIFCASITEQIPFGTDDYLKYIRDAIIATKSSGGMLIALITSSFMESDFCKYEIGASWIEEIPIRPIFFPPISFSDHAIQGSPLSKTQAVKIDKEDLNGSSYSVLYSLVIDGKKNEQISGYISSVDEGNRMLITKDTTDRIVGFVKRVEDTRVYFDILRHTCGIYHAEHYSQTLIDDKDYDDQLVTLNLDFSAGAPPYAGYYVRPLNPKDWTKFIENKFFLRFDLFASTGIDNIYIELKCISYQIIDKKCKLTQNGWRTYSIYLGNQDPQDGWDNMKEICFVLKYDSMSVEKGYIQIKNLRIEREPII